ncbi:ornithine decarboxylase [Haematobacter massiliensis]|uniref:ornithine decarboxylase n=1 Tax=Haematobacter massiliensis TaxID=195105 RepID=A0A086YCQ5_9RHOB|nr:type III PLP-dependent enzyme [Haematobacter massiliensis]KFI32055.1 ornithine decarboxylase [Haematobacter massiliensis]OWJ72658.1 ornithine decarboxylase [Haematobacter massiliensis]OWJ86797.1 ornithine decarboxylase [Haematobacter massiliensis]
MGLSKTIWTTPSEYLRIQQPDAPVMFFSPAVLQATARRFIDGFPGFVTYAVKSNPDEIVIENLAAAGVQGFDVASPAEMRLIRRIAPSAAMHYNNPVRARSEILTAVELGVASYSVDSRSELAKLIALVPAQGTEISVRFKLPVAGAAYNFGAKFGATVELAAELLATVADAGFVPSLTFHPGTQCTEPSAWDAYIRAAAEIAAMAGVKIARLNVGGGFPSHRLNEIEPQLEAIFRLIDTVAAEAFGSDRPALVCEPGRGLCAGAFSLASRVKAVRDDEHVFLNDGVYGAFAELPLIGIIDRTEVISPDGVKRGGETVERIVFGPTCDSVDRLPGVVALPGDMQEEDYVLFHGMGAYSIATNTRFNGFGELSVATVLKLKG